jgi:hypothetical protein
LEQEAPRVEWIGHGQSVTQPLPLSSSSSLILLLLSCLVVAVSLLVVFEARHCFSGAAGGGCFDASSFAEISKLLLGRVFLCGMVPSRESLSVRAT